MDDQIGINHDKAMVTKADHMAIHYSHLRSRGYDVSSIVESSPRRNGSGGVGHHDRPANLLLVGSSSGWEATEPTATATIATHTRTTRAAREEMMTILKGGVPHHVRFNWRGACLWILIVAMFAGWVR